jgi:hypothetical protein
VAATLLGALKEVWEVKLKGCHPFIEPYHITANAGRHHIVDVKPVGQYELQAGLFRDA